MSNNKQLTAVEQLISKIPLGMRMQLAELGVDFEQAKEIEKQQTMNFALEYMMQSKPIVDYYNETYGGNK